MSKKRRTFRCAALFIRFMESVVAVTGRARAAVLTEIIPIEVVVVISAGVAGVAVVTARIAGIAGIASVARVAAIARVASVARIAAIAGAGVAAVPVGAEKIFQRVQKYVVAARICAIAVIARVAAVTEAEPVEVRDGVIPVVIAVAKVARATATAVTGITAHKMTLCGKIFAVSTAFHFMQQREQTVHFISVINE